MAQQFDFSPKLQTPDYSPILKILSQRMQMQNPYAQAIPGLAQNLGQGIQQRSQKDKWKNSINSLVQGNPKLAPYAGVLSQHPEMLGQILPGIMKTEVPRKEWSVVPGMTTKEGYPLQQDPFTGEMRPGTIKVNPTGYGATIGPIRKAQYTLQDLPSNQGPNTAGGAAYQVKVAARQGKSLIAKATNPQAISLASADLGRAVQRSAPLAETIGASNFGQNLVTQWNLLRQKVTSDPKSSDIPKIRRELYNMFDELDRAASPWITSQLNSMDEVGFKISPQMRKRQLGEDIQDIPFIDLSSKGDLSSMSDDELRRIAGSVK